MDESFETLVRNTQEAWEYGHAKCAETLTAVALARIAVALEQLVEQCRNTGDDYARLGQVAEKLFGRFGDGKAVYVSPPWAAPSGTGEG